MPFVKILDSYAQLSENCQNELRKRAHKIICREGTQLLAPSEPNQHLFMVEKGLLRVFHQSDEEPDAPTREITSWFVPEGHLAVSAVSFFSQLPADEYIEAIEDSIVYKLSHADLEILYQQYPELNAVARAVMAQYIKSQQFRLRLLTYKNVLQRYRYFLSYYPGISKRVSLRLIATCLDVEYHHLSRVRKEL
jgi:CRP/FNR family transcriptional regulator, anaerobic regulatory protein